MYQKSRAWIELNMDNLSHNVMQIKEHLSFGCKLMPAVKANAYGHGMIPISKALAGMGITDFCVASAAEGAMLRKAGIEGQILVLGYTHPKAFPLLAQYDLTQTVVDACYAGILAGYGKPIKVHVSVDTGMRRLGERSDHLSSILSIWNYKTLSITGLFSHLCVADSADPLDVQFTLMQFQRFDAIVDALHQKGIGGFHTHIQSSYGFLNYPEYTYDYIRPGIVLYGCQSQQELCPRLELSLRPVLSLKSRLETIKWLLPGESAGYGLTYTADRPLIIGAVSIGYADGIPRSLSGKGYVLIHGKKAPIIGRICMDQLLCDVTEIPEAAPMDEVVIIGTSCSDKQEQCDRKEMIRVEDLAALCGTISNEILSCLGSRPPRIILSPKTSPACRKI